MTLKHYRRFITTLSLLLLFLISSFSLALNNRNLMNRNGLAALKELLTSMVTPTINQELINIGLEALLQTLAYAGVAITLSIIFAFMLAIPASEIFKSTNFPVNGARLLLTFMRGIHEIIWALFFVATIGLTPLSAILAISIPYAGALGKIFSDIFKSCPTEPIRALKNLGANNMTLLFYGYLPLCYQQLKSYFFYRFECAIRSSAVLSFIGVGGIGYQIFISLQDLDYQDAWFFIYLLMIVVIFIDNLSKLSRQVTKKNLQVFSNQLLTLLLFFSWAYIILVEKLSWTSLWSSKNLHFSKQFLTALFDFSSDSSYFLKTEWLTLTRLTIDTIQMSILAIAGASLIALFLLPFSKNKIVQFVFIYTRTIPEMIWAVLLIFIFKPGILPGAIALGLHNLGILGKLFGEVIDDMDPRSSNALKNAGANAVIRMFYSTIPELYNRFLSYILYRFEIIVRSSIIVGIVGAGGLGAYLKLNMSFFHYDKVGMVLITYLLIIFVVDQLSTRLQKWHL